MASAEIITIGTEILLGELVDTNAPYIARQLRELGLDLYRKTSVGDNPTRIAQAIRQSLERCDVVITTGGLGPTVDDPTREAVALAMGVETEFRDELWVQIQARFQRFGRKPTENNRRQAVVPQGALAVENPVGTAPAFIVERGSQAVISLPGVPREMETLMTLAVIPYLKKKYPESGVIRARILHTAGVGESVIDEKIEDLEQQGNPSVGLAAHSGQVDIRITVKAANVEEADAKIQVVENVLKRRLGRWIYGVDGETLEGEAMANLKRLGWTLAVLEAGLGGELIRRLAQMGGMLLGAELITEVSGEEDLREKTWEFRKEKQAASGMGVSLVIGPEKHEITVVLITPDGEKTIQRPFGGPAELAPHWATNHSLDIIRLLGDTK